MSAAEKIDYDSWTEKLEELPTLPAVVYELSRIINDPMSSTTDIEKVMEKDQALTTTVLKLVNSAYYAIPGGVSNLSRAIAYIGYDTVHQLVLAASIIKALEVKGPSKFDLNLFWQHSMGVGMACEAIAKFTKHRTPADLFTSGLVHDMGKMALFIIEPDTLLKASEYAVAQGVTMLDAEAATGAPVHTILGNLLAQKWNLPVQIQNVILYHHEIDPAKRQGLSQEMNLNVDMVFLANLMIHGMKFGNSGHSKVAPVSKAIFDRLNIKANDLKELTVEIKKALQSADAFLAIIGV